MNNRLCILFIFIFFILTGCSNYKELNQVAIVVGMGIDYIPKKDVYEVTFQIINPSGNIAQGSSGGSAVPVLSYKDTGKTISEAARNSSKRFSRQNIYSHIALIVIGEQLAKKESLNFIFDVFERDAKIRVNIPVLIARNVSVPKVMNILPALDKVPVKSMIGKLENTSKLLGENGEVLIYEVIGALSSKGREPAISGISVNDPRNIGNSAENYKKVRNVSAFLNGVGVFKNGKLVGWLDGKQAKSIQVVGNTLKQTNLRIPCNKKRYNSMQVDRLHSDVKVDIKNNQANINIYTYASGILDEILCNKDISNDKVIKEFEHEAEQELKKEMTGGILKAQKLKSDVFGFGDILHRTHPTEWEKQKEHWAETFAKANVNVHVNISISGTGMRVKPYPY